MKNIFKSRRTKKRGKGFTLVELLLYVAISSVLLSLTSFFMFNLLEARIKNQTISEVEQQGLQIMQILNHSLRNAEAITFPSSGQSGSSLTLDVLTVTNDPTVFDLSSGVFRITEGNKPPVSLSNSRVVVSGLNFQNLSYSGTSGIIRVSFTITSFNSSGRNEYYFSKTFRGSTALRKP